MHGIAVLLLSVSISTIPATPLIERTKSGQALNFDLVLENHGSAPVTIEEIEATVVDAKGALVLQRRLASNGGSIEMLPHRELAPGAKVVVFNPFADFDAALDLANIRYDVTVGDDDVATTVVHPRTYDTKADLILPLRGRLFVHDGHDALSHHRRLDITGDMTTALGIRSNMSRYAYDFTIVDAHGDDLWRGLGQPVIAPADGVVVRTAGNRPDSTKTERAPLDYEAVMQDLSLIFGNYAVIDHGNGEFSLLAHMRNGSVSLHQGQRVKRGEKIGEVGCSGDAIFPHLHYQLQSDANTGEGLPSYFSNFDRFTGKGFVHVSRGQVDTGDVVTSK